MNPHSLLVVDSDPSVHDHWNRLLESPGRVIHNCLDGGDALKTLRHNDFDVVVAGQGHNGLGGVKLLRKIRALRPAARVIVTGEADACNALAALRYRAYTYFHRPVPDIQLADSVQQAAGSTSWKDDIRVVSARPEWTTMDVRCKLEAAERTIQFVREIEIGLDAQAREDICVAFRELLLNAIEHGGKSDPRKRVRASFIRMTRALMVYISDPGSGFSMDSLPHAAISNPEDSPTRHVEIRNECGKRPGGFGIMMTKVLVDELLYNERGNAVMFVKYL